MRVRAKRRPCGVRPVATACFGAPEAGGAGGLGLAVARGFTEALRGTVHAEDTPGGGLTMVLSVPMAPERAEQPALSAPGGSRTSDAFRSHGTE